LSLVEFVIVIIVDFVIFIVDVVIVVAHFLSYCLQLLQMQHHYLFLTHQLAAKISVIVLALRIDALNTKRKQRDIATIGPIRT
jgi:hypothetical protein